MEDSKYLNYRGLQQVSSQVNTRLKTVAVMPISADNGAVVLYLGEDTADYKKGHLYKSVSQTFYAYRTIGPKRCLYLLSDPPTTDTSIYVNKSGDYARATTSTDLEINGDSGTYITKIPMDRFITVKFSDYEDTCDCVYDSEINLTGITWVDITPSGSTSSGLQVLSSAPSSPVVGDAFVYSGSDTENFKQGHTYQYVDEGYTCWVFNMHDLSSSYYGHYFFYHKNSALLTEGTSWYARSDPAFPASDVSQLSANLEIQSATFTVVDEYTVQFTLSGTNCTLHRTSNSEAYQCYATDGHNVKPTEAAGTRTYYFYTQPSPATQLSDAYVSFPKIYDPALPGGVASILGFDSAAAFVSCSAESLTLHFSFNTEDVVIPRDSVHDLPATSMDLPVVFWKDLTSGFVYSFTSVPVAQIESMLI